MTNVGWYSADCRCVGTWAVQDVVLDLTERRAGARHEALPIPSLARDFT